MAGQVSLGHAFFMGVGAYTAVVLGGEQSNFPGRAWDSRCGSGFRRPGSSPALVGALVAPTAVRVRGLYLAFVTIGLVFVGDHVFRNRQERLAVAPGSDGSGRRSSSSSGRRRHPLVSLEYRWFLVRHRLEPPGQAVPVPGGVWSCTLRPRPQEPRPHPDRASLCRHP